MKATVKYWKSAKKKHAIRKIRSCQETGRGNFWKKEDFGIQYKHAGQGRKERLSEKYARYAAYENAEQNFHIDESLSADQMEARYETITSVLSQELKDLEAQGKESGRTFPAGNGRP